VQEQDEAQEEPTPAVSPETVIEEEAEEEAAHERETAGDEPTEARGPQMARGGADVPGSGNRRRDASDTRDRDVLALRRLRRHEESDALTASRDFHVRALWRSGLREAFDADVARHGVPAGRVHACLER
jgi:hypothetical protein